MRRPLSPRALLTTALACWLVGAMALLAGCTTSATPARTVYMIAAPLDVATSAYGIGHGHRETNPLGFWGGLALKGGLFWAAEQTEEPWRSRLYWFAAAVSVGAATNNVIVLSTRAR